MSKKQINITIRTSDIESIVRATTRDVLSSRVEEIEKQMRALESEAVKRVTVLANNSKKGKLLRKAYNKPLKFYHFVRTERYDQVYRRKDASNTAMFRVCGATIQLKFSDAQLKALVSKLKSLCKRLQAAQMDLENIRTKGQYLANLLNRNPKDLSVVKGVIQKLLLKHEKEVRQAAEAKYATRT